MSKKIKTIKGFIPHPFHKKGEGFTLIELLVVVSIFAILMTLVANVFMVSQQRNKKIIGEERALNSTRIIMEKMAQDIRTGRPDYSASWPESNNPAELRLMDQDKNQIAYRFSTTACAPGISGCLEYSSDNGATWSVITGNDVEVLALSFYVYPRLDPFNYNPTLGNFNSDLQPRVTIYLKVRPYKVAGAKEMEMQTTVSSRAYLR